MLMLPRLQELLLVDFQRQAAKEIIASEENWNEIAFLNSLEDSYYLNADKAWSKFFDMIFTWDTKKTRIVLELQPNNGNNCRTRRSGKRILLVVEDQLGFDFERN